MAAMDARPGERAGELAAAAMTVLPSTHPRLWPTDEDLRGARSRLERAYNDYVCHVSPAQMAISLETAAYVLWLAQRLDAKTAIDFGSGFTSYVLRVAGCNTCSVDDSPEWLAWTERFLARYDCRHGAISLWGEFVPGKADVVVYDFSSGQMRDDHFTTAVAEIAPGGVAVLDDAQHSGHQQSMHKACAHFGYDLFGLQDITKDYYGRYAALVVRP